MDLAILQKKNGSYVFHIDQLVKQSRPNRDQPTLVIPRFLSDPNLCVASTLEEYIERTAPIRDNENQLFISGIRPHNGVTKASISRWIKIVIKAAGINTVIFTPHSTRAASTSKAQSCDVSINSILKAASWKSDCVFHRFYNKTIESDPEHTQFENAVLSAVQ